MPNNNPNKIPSKNPNNDSGRTFEQKSEPNPEHNSEHQSKQNPEQASELSDYVSSAYMALKFYSPMRAAECVWLAARQMNKHPNKILPSNQPNTIRHAHGILSLSIRSAKQQSETTTTRQKQETTERNPEHKSEHKSELNCRTTIQQK